MRELKTEIDIAAPPERVWAILSDFASFPEWNPFMVEGHGRPAPGERLVVRLQPPKGRAFTFRPRVLKAETNRELRWLGHTGVPDLFDGEHILRLDPTDIGTHFVQREEFRGVLLPLLWHGLDTKTRAGFEAMNHALKERAEADTA